MLIDFSEGKGGGERERNIDVREKHQWAAPRMCPIWGLNPKIRHVP